MVQAHQLAAIMFTDIVGYTALMGEDEQQAFALLQKNRQIQKPLIESYNGQWIKEMGDGVLASFPSASDAVSCAHAIRQACLGEPRLRLRIGIHLGDVVFEDHDVFGEGVNIAARLQALAPIGGIWISESVQQNIANKKDIRTRFVKTETLKHVKEPVRIYEVETNEAPAGAPAVTTSKPTSKARGKLRAALLSLGLLLLLLGGYLLYMRMQKKAPAAGQEHSIAVLYFDNMSGDPEQEYFSDGITEEIITRLARIEGLKVISRTSVQAYKNKTLGLKQIARELKVSSVLEGSVRRSANSVRVTAQLIDAQTDRHIWAESYDRELHDIFAIQSEIASSIAKKFAVAVSKDARDHISRQPTANLEAYDNYQKGRYFLYKKYLNTAKDDDWQKSKKFFEAAIRLDPGYAEAYAGLAEVYDALNNFYGGPLPDSLIRLKVELARKAVQLDPQSSFAHAAMVWAVINRPSPDTDSAYNHAKKAFLINPSDPINLYNLSFVLSIGFGLHNEAVALTRKAIQTDPMDPLLHAMLGQYYMFLGNYPEARKAFRSSLDLSSEQFFMEPASLFWLAYMGDYTEVEKRLPQRGASYNFVRSFVAALRNEPGKIKPALRDNLVILLAANRHRAVPGLLDRLEAEMNKEFKGGIVSFDFLSSSYFFDVYRTEPRFQRILARAQKDHERYQRKYGNIRVPE